MREGNEGCDFVPGAGAEVVVFDRMRMVVYVPTCCVGIRVPLHQWLGVEEARGEEVEAVASAELVFEFGCVGKDFSDEFGEGDLGGWKVVVGGLLWFARGDVGEQAGRDFALCCRRPCCPDACFLRDVRQHQESATCVFDS